MDIKKFALDIFEEKSSLSQLEPTSEDALYSKLVETLGVSQTDILVCLEELYINAIEHGENKKIQIFLDYEAPYLYFAIKDEGPGIFQTVPSNPKLGDLKGKSSSSIMRLSLEQGITGTGIIGRGIGLWLASKLCADLDSELILISNQGIVLQSSQVHRQEVSDKNYRGSFVGLKLKLEKL